MIIMLHTHKEIMSVTRRRVATCTPKIRFYCDYLSEQSRAELLLMQDHSQLVDTRYPRVQLVWGRVRRLNGILGYGGNKPTCSKKASTAK